MPRNGYKRPGYRSCGKMVYGDAKKALIIARNVKSLLNVEVKNLDVQQSAVSLTNVPIVLPLSVIPQDDTTNGRNGSQVKAISIEFSAYFIWNASGASTTVRILIVCDKQTNQVLYLNSDLLNDVTSEDNIISPYNLDNRHRFQVLYDHTFQMHAAQTTYVIKRTIRMSKLLRYDGSTPSIADMTQNSLSIVQFASEATNRPTIHMFSRLRFVDN